MSGFENRGRAVMDFAERFSPWFCDVPFEELTRNQANERFGSTEAWVEQKCAAAVNIQRRSYVLLSATLPMELLGTGSLVCAYVRVRRMG